jgi:hypothetical protein
MVKQDEQEAGTSTTDDKISDFAEELGRLLGTAQAKAQGWLQQREDISKTLLGIRDTASRLLSDLGHQAETAVPTIRRRGRPAASKNQGAAKRGPGRPPKATAANSGRRGPGRPKGKSGMSAEGRAKIAAAQKARWAAKRAAENK